MSSSMRISNSAWRIVSRASSSRPILCTSGHHAPLPRPSHLILAQRTATSTSEPPSSTDPSFAKALRLLEDGTRLIESGDVQGALEKYKESVNVKETSGGYFNLGVCEYTQNNHPGAIKAWERSIALTPSADAYTNLASAYIMMKPPQAALAIKHLTSALELTPDDPEVAFNLAAILESTGNLEASLKMYERAEKGGIERAGQNIRSVSAKILAGSGSAQA
ncbi:hypothetical protein BD324DRAFT_650833 [Kockovaella imperatae]|uniref:Uncharacterized protein n=1 Tax=Kockovaella imperatae TaxID=4999 RepID=A0A1Y1UI65_9TREE|nr:hypothetical protein BD324DRAFT_650833 [Kockovaella imperatae]ORX37227.1 hypothetical protein BD324DRAFT_650833 [Kockovaella imperatae]